MSSIQPKRSTSSTWGRRTLLAALVVLICAAVLPVISGCLQNRDAHRSAPTIIHKSPMQSMQLRETTAKTLENTYKLRSGFAFTCTICNDNSNATQWDGSFTRFGSDQMWLGDNSQSGIKFPGTNDVFYMGGTMIYPDGNGVWHMEVRCPWMAQNKLVWAGTHGEILPNATQFDRDESSFCCDPYTPEELEPLRDRPQHKPPVVPEDWKWPGTRVNHKRRYVIPGSQLRQILGSVDQTVRQALLPANPPGAVWAGHFQEAPHNTLVLYWEQTQGPALPGTTDETVALHTAGTRIYQDTNGKDWILEIAAIHNVTRERVVLWKGRYQAEDATYLPNGKQINAADQHARTAPYRRIAEESAATQPVVIPLGRLRNRDWPDAPPSPTAPDDNDD